MVIVQKSAQYWKRLRMIECRLRSGRKIMVDIISWELEEAAWWEEVQGKEGT